MILVSGVESSRESTFTSMVHVSIGYSKRKSTLTDCQGTEQVTMSYCHFQTPAIVHTAEFQGQYFGANTHVDNPERDLFSILGNLEFDAELLHICQEPLPSDAVLPELHLDTPEYTHLLLPTSSSQCCFEEDVHQCDVLLANHPLLPHLQELIQGNPNHTLLSSPELQCTGVQEADCLMHKAVNMLKKSGRINYVKQVDDDCSALAHEISSFCQARLESPQGKENRQQSSDIEGICKQSTSAEVSKQSSKFLQKDIGPKKLRRESDIQLRKRRSALSDEAAAVLRRWLFEHAHHPYPNDDEKDELCLRTSLTNAQLNNWFINARRRILPQYHNQCEGL